MSHSLWLVLLVGSCARSGYELAVDTDAGDVEEFTSVDRAENFDLGDYGNNTVFDDSRIELASRPANLRELQLTAANFDISGLVSVWRFNEAAGNIIDQIGANDGEVHGSVEYAQPGPLNGALGLDGASLGRAHAILLRPGHHGVPLRR